MDKISTKVAGLPTKTLKEMAKSLYVDVRAEADMVLSAVLDILMGRLPEAEFVSFCESMEA